MATLTSKLIVSLIDQVTAPARGIAGAVKNLQSAQRANRAEMDATRGRMIDAAAAAYAMGRAVAAPAKAAMEFESAMADVRKVVDFETPQAFASMGQDIIDMSTRLPMAANDIASIVAAAGAAGIAGDDLMRFAEMATKVGVAFDISADEAGTSMARMKTALGLTINETGAVADVLNHLSNSMASTAPQLLDYMARVGSAGLNYGFTIEQTAALGSAMIASGVGADVAATSLRAVGRALTRGASATGRQAEAYTRLGLDSTRVSKSMQEDATGTLRTVMERIRELPEHMQAATLSDLFGDEARAIAPLLNNLDLYNAALGLVADETAYLGSTEEEYAARAATTANNMRLLANKAHAVSIAIGNALLPAMNAFANAIGPVLIALADLAAQNPQVILTILGLVGSLVALRVATIAARWAFLFLKGGVLDVALFATRGAGALLSMVNPLNLVRAAMAALRFAVIGTGVGAILVALAAAGLFIYNNWDGIASLFTAFGRAFRRAMAPVEDILGPVFELFEESFKFVEGLLGPIDASTQEWANWGEMLGTTVGGAIASTITAVRSLFGWLGDATSGFREMRAALAGFVVNFVMGTVPAFFTWVRDATVSALSIVGNFIAGTTAPMLDWLLAAAGAVNLVVDVGLGVLDSILAWIIDAVRQGVQIVVDVLPGDVPGWLTRLYSGVKGDAGIVGGSGQGAVINGEVDAGLNVPTGAASAAVEGARAAGGSIVGGKTYLVGEHGPELVTPSRSGWVHTADETARMGARGGNIGPIHLGGIVVNGIQNPGAIVDEVARQLEERLRVMLDGIHADTEYRG